MTKPNNLNSNINNISRRIPKDLREMDNFISQSSFYLDNVIFEPFYSRHSSSIRNKMFDQIYDKKVFYSIENDLILIKISFVGISILCCVFSIFNVLRGRLIPSIFYIMLALDSFRVSYNCYYKTYIGIMAEEYGGNLKKLGETVFEWAKSMVGLKGDTEKISKEISWKLLFKETFTLSLYNTGMEMINDSKKRK
jgi:hypothetical protein